MPVLSIKSLKKVAQKVSQLDRPFCAFCYLLEFVKCLTNLGKKRRGSLLNLYDAVGSAVFPTHPFKSLTGVGVALVAVHPAPYTKGGIESFNNIDGHVRVSFVICIFVS
jgi:hypothetical protein